MNSLISVLIAVSNEPKEYLQQAISSLQNQTCKLFEAIVVLDNPKNTVAKQYLKTVAKQDKRFRIILNKQNLGLAQSLNIAMANAKGTYYARFDADDICVPTRFAQQLEYMKQNPNTDLLFSGAVVIDDKGKEISKIIPQTHVMNNLQKHIFLDPKLIHPTLFAKAQILAKFQYNTKYRRSQDYDLWLRLLGNAKFACISKPLIYYRVPRTTPEHRIRKQREWNAAARTIAANHASSFRYNIWYWYFRLRLLTVAAILLLPDSILFQIISFRKS